MNHLRTVRTLVPMLVCILSAPGVWAQHVETRVENAEIVYVQGNDVIVKLTDGEVRQFEIPDTCKFNIDGKDVTVLEMKPGMKLTATIITATPPRWVDTVEVIEVGKVWRNVGSSLVITTPEGENKMYRVSSGGKVTIDGIEKTLAQLREGDKITATIVKITIPPEKGNAAVVVHKAPRTPARVGVLLIDEGAKPPVPPGPTGMWGTSSIIILVILVLLVAVAILWAFRRKRKA
jgi:hypothetical protein